MQKRAENHFPGLYDTAKPKTAKEQEHRKQMALELKGFCFKHKLSQQVAAPLIGCTFQGFSHLVSHYLTTRTDVLEEMTRRAKQLEELAMDWEAFEPFLTKAKADWANREEERKRKQRERAIAEGRIPAIQGPITSLKQAKLELIRRRRSRNPFQNPKNAKTNPWQTLAHAVCMQGVNDYVTAFERNEVAPSPENARILKEETRFLLSDYFLLLSGGVDFTDFLETLQDRARKELQDIEQKAPAVLQKAIKRQQAKRKNPSSHQRREVGKEPNHDNGKKHHSHCG